VPGKNGGGVSIAGASLGERVRTARKALGMSQAQLAGEELTKGFISQLESGTVRPSIRSLQIIAGRLGKPLDHFLGDEVLSSEKRVIFHRLAAETAVEQRNWAAVREHCALGLESPVDGAERASFLLLLGRASQADRDFERTFELVNEALGLIKIDASAQLAAELLTLRGHAYFQLNQLAAATEAYETARDVMEKYEVPEPRLRSRLLIALGSAYRRLKRTSKAITAYESALAHASRTSQLVLAAQGYMGMAASHYDSGELDAAIANYRRARELFERLSDIDFELSCFQSIATVQFENGDIAAAKTSAERAMERAIGVGNARWAAVVEVLLSRIALQEGRAEEALRLAKHGEKMLSETDDKIQRADALGATGAALEALGRTVDADKAYQASLDLYTKIDDLADRSGMAAEYARVLKSRGQIDEAFDMLELARGGVTRR